MVRWEPTIKAIIHEKRSTITVRSAVARLESYVYTQLGQYGRHARK